MKSIPSATWLALCASAPLLVLSLAASPSGETAAPLDEARGPWPAYVPPPIAELAGTGMRPLIEYFEEDLQSTRESWDVSSSPRRRERERTLIAHWTKGVEALDYDALGEDAKLDWQLFRNRLGYLARRVELEEQRFAEIAELVPFAEAIAALQEGRRALTPLDSEEAAELLTRLAADVEALRERVERASEAEEDGDAEPREAGATKDEADDDHAPPIETTRLLANRASQTIWSLRRSLRSWYDYRAGYDPLFGWWCERPFAAANEALDDYARHLRERVAGVDAEDDDTLLGDPIGRDALIAELEREWIPYTPEELIEIAERELAWCDARMLEASRELGFADDWRAAQEHVKDLHVAPGEQPYLIRDLAYEAIDFLEAHDLLSIPEFAKGSWRMEMMSPERQKYTPYFTGGEVISVSFPTGSMEHEDKRMSLRGNNIHFSRATVHHELIPGHHLQQFMNARYKPYRGVFRTPFWVEGWALYWEMLLWDRDFPRGPEDRIGMLFWRKHRCARILFSLSFHLGTRTAEECVELLTSRVGHEKRNATAEVRRSIQGGYGPLYQAAYMLGGLQFRALYRELVDSGRTTARAYHDAVLREGPIPVELLRSKLVGQPLARDARTSWRFYPL